MTEEKGHSLPI